MKETKLTNKTAADLVRAAARSQEQAADRESLMIVADDIAAGDHANAHSYACSVFDTYLRDEIPAAVWTFIGGTLVKDL
jgi:hypothetical protein